MKRTILAICAFAALAATADVTGDYNTWFGYHAGNEASGDRATMQGAAAGSGAQGVVRSDFFGAAAGAFSSGVRDSAAFGYRALRYANNLSNVVAIGSHAFEGRTNLVNATMINGQFYASETEGKFYVKTSPDMADANAPIYYQGGTLYLNASQIVTGSGGVISGGGTADTSTFDFFVSAATGNDAWDGKTVNSAKKTLDAALALVTTNDMRICLLAGDYAVPQWFSQGDSTPWRVDIIGVSGVGKTSIDGALNQPGDKLRLWCATTAWTYFEGITFRHFEAPTESGTTYHGAFMRGYFYNCVFEDMDMELKSRRSMFFHSVLDTCRMRDTVKLAKAYTHSDTDNFERNYGGLMYGCDVYDSVLEWGLGTNVVERPNIMASSYAENSFIHAPPSYFCPYRGTASYPSVTGRRGDLVDVTLIVDELRNSTEYRAPFYTNCLLGVSYTPANNYQTLCTNAVDALNAVGADFRPDNQHLTWRWYGYNSAADRAIADAIMQEVKAYLNNNGWVNYDEGFAQSMGRMLMAANAEAEEDEGEPDGGYVEVGGMRLPAGSGGEEQ